MTFSVFLQLALLVGVPDADSLKVQADSAEVPALVAFAVATVESGSNLDTLLRGKNGDLGRFQVRPTVWRRAFGGECQRLTSWRGNVRCGLRILRWCYEKEGEWPAAIRCYNGSGPATMVYLAKVERAAGRLTLRVAGKEEAWPVRLSFSLP